MSELRQRQNGLHVQPAQGSAAQKKAEADALNLDPDQHHEYEACFFCGSASCSRLSLRVYILVWWTCRHGFYDDHLSVLALLSLGSSSV